MSFLIGASRHRGMAEKYRSSGAEDRPVEWSRIVPDRAPAYNALRGETASCNPLLWRDLRHILRRLRNPPRQSFRKAR